MRCTIWQFFGTQLCCIGAVLLIVSGVFPYWTVDEAHELAQLTLISISVIICILVVSFSMCCCNRCDGCMSMWVLLAAISSSTGVAIYAYYQFASPSIGITSKIGSNTRSEVKYFGWAFWVAVSACGIQLLSALFLSFSSRCRCIGNNKYAHQHNLTLS